MSDVVAELRRRAGQTMNVHQYEAGLLEAADLIARDPLYQAAPKLRDALEHMLQHTEQLERYEDGWCDDAPPGKQGEGCVHLAEARAILNGLPKGTSVTAYQCGNCNRTFDTSEAAVDHAFGSGDPLVRIVPGIGCRPLKIHKIPRGLPA